MKDDKRGSRERYKILGILIAALVLVAILLTVYHAGSPATIRFIGYATTYQNYVVDAHGPYGWPVGKNASLIGTCTGPANPRVTGCAWDSSTVTAISAVCTTLSSTTTSISGGFKVNSTLRCNSARNITIKLVGSISSGTLMDVSTLSIIEPRCGDALCNGAETCSSCAQDCGVCQPRYVVGDTYPMQNYTEPWIKIGTFQGYLPGITDYATLKAQGKLFIQGGFRYFAMDRFEAKAQALYDAAAELKAQGGPYGKENIEVIRYFSWVATKAGIYCVDCDNNLYGETYLLNKIQYNPNDFRKEWFIQSRNSPYSDKAYYYWNNISRAMDPRSDRYNGGWPTHLLNQSLILLDNQYFKLNPGSYGVEWRDRNFDGYSAIFFDDLWADVFDYTLPENPVPLDPINYTDDADWRNKVRASLVLSGQFKTQFNAAKSKNKKIYFNFARYKPISGLWQDWITIPGVDGYMDEHFGNNWYQDVQRLADAESAGKIVLANQYPQAGYLDTTVVMFYFPSYLLAANGNSVFMFQRPYTIATVFPIYRVRLGAPLGNRVCYKAGQVSSSTSPDYCVRDFTNGKVIVNPSATTARTVTVTGSYYSLNANAQITQVISGSGSISVPRYGGVILIKQ